MVFDYDDQDDQHESTDPEPAAENLQLVIPPRGELHIKFSEFFNLPRDEKNRLEREEPEVFRNGKYGSVIRGGDEGKAVDLPTENLGTAILFRLDDEGHVLSSEQFFP